MVKRPMKEAAPIYILSGGVGASGEQVVHTVLAQFPGRQVPVKVIANVRYEEQIDQTLDQAAASGGTVVHTMVETHLRDVLISLAESRNVSHIDLMGPLIERLSDRLGCKPLGQPGLYRKLRQDYFERVEAIEYTMAHDDGRDPQGWSRAEILLIGASRTGKTPLSLYLSVLGWKAANFPLVPHISPPAELFELDPARVIGILMEPGQLLMHREKRQRRLGAIGASDYTNPPKVYEEVEASKAFFNQHGFTLIDVTDKPIESSADEVVRIITRRFPAS